MKWVPFWFEGNNWFGMVEGPEDFRKLMALYPGGRIMSAKECVRGDDPRLPEMPPKFGFTSECDGRITLREFLEEKQMPGMLIVWDHWFEPQPEDEVLG